MPDPPSGTVTFLCSDQESLTLYLALGDKHGLYIGMGDAPGNTTRARRSIVGRPEQPCLLWDQA
jgi:hypothetical protein